MAKPGLRLRLEIEGDGALIDEVHGIGQRARDAKPVLRLIHALMEVSAHEQFETEGESAGAKWRPDKPETIARKRALGLSDKTEIRTGALRDSLFGGADSVHRLARSSTSYGTRKFYAVYQGHERRLLEITMKDADKWSEMMIDFIFSGKAG